MNTQRSLYEIEVALANHSSFSYIKNIVAFNVNGLGECLNINHECDMLVLSKAGYLTEIEIKRSWSDFLADFKKDHSHESKGLIKFFYYCVPISIVDKVYDKLEDLGVKYTGVIAYDEDLKISMNGKRWTNHNGDYEYYFVQQHPHRKLFLEEQLQVARYGAMRAIGLKQKLINSN